MAANFQNYVGFQKQATNFIFVALKVTHHDSHSYRGSS